MALALDGSNAVNSASAVSSINISLTTANANDIIAIVALINSGGGAHHPLASVTSTNTTGWSQRTISNAGAAESIELWYGKAASALSAESITCATDGTAWSFATIVAFGISGADTTTITDSNVALPATGTTSPVSLTTSNANDFLIGAYRFATTASPTQGAGWTLISGANFCLVEYQIVAATQSGLSAAIGTGNTDENAGIGDAVISAAGGGGGPTFILMPQICL